MTELRAQHAHAGVGRRRRPVLGALAAVIGLVAALLLATAPPARANLYSPIPTDGNGDIQDTFSDTDALGAFVVSDLNGGKICVVRDIANTDAVDCGKPAWGRATTVVSIGTTETLVSGPRLVPGRWRLLAQNGAQKSISDTFTVAACPQCDPSFGQATAKRWKDDAGARLGGYAAGCTGFALLDAYSKAKTVLDGFTSAFGFGNLFVGLAFGGLQVGGSMLLDAYGPKSTEDQAKEVLKTLVCGVRDMYADIKADPPDPDYRTVSPPGVRPVPSSTNSDVDAANAAVETLRANGEAVLIAFQRYQGALAAGDTTWVNRQAAAMADDARTYVDTTDQAAAALRAVEAQLQAGPEGSRPAVDPSTRDALQSYFDRVTTSGFTAAEIDHAHQSGFTDDQLAYMRTQFDLDTAAVPNGATLPALVETMAQDLQDSADSWDEFARESAAIAADTAAPLAVSFTRDPSSGQAPLTVTFTDTSSGGTSPYSVAWDFGDGTSGTGATATHTYALPGSYTATETVTDADGTSDSTSAVTTVTVVPNTPPVAAAAATPSSGVAPLVVAFSSAGSHDPDGSIASYAWTFGDGGTSTAANPGHTYTGTGAFTATLVVTDNRGATDSTSTIVNVSSKPNTPPTALFTADPDHGDAPLPVTFDASASRDPDGNITAYAWDFGDGATGSGKSVSHTFATAGTFVVTLSVTDDAGAVTRTTSSVAVSQPPNVPPTAAATATPSRGPAPLPVQFDGTGSRDSDGSVVGYSWDFGDGTAAGSGATVSHTYTTPGTYTAVLVVTDDRGGTGRTTTTVTVDPPTPQAVDDAFTVTGGDSLYVVGNDVDPLGGPLTVSALTQPAHGAVTCSQGHCLYQPTPGYAGADAFTYRATTTYGVAASATVTLTVNPPAVNTTAPPVAVDDPLVVPPGRPTVIDPLANDTGAAGGLTITAVTTPEHGTVVCPATGGCTYTPPAGFTGADSFTYQVTDSRGGTAVGLVLLAVVDPGTGFTAAPPGVTAAALTAVTQGSAVNWTGTAVLGASVPSESAAGLHPTVTIELSTGQTVDTGSVRGATGWTVTWSDDGSSFTATPGSSPRFLRFTASDGSALGSSLTTALPAPVASVSQGTGGDGHVPIVVGDRVYGTFHHSYPTAVWCVDRGTASTCPGYPRAITSSAYDLVGPGVVVGSRIFVHLYPQTGYAQLAPVSLYCWDTTTDSSCGAVEVGYVPGNGNPLASAPVLVGGKIWLGGPGGKLYCADPATMAPCAPVADGMTDSGQWIDVAAHGDRVYLGNQTQVGCVLPGSGTTCPGWQTALTTPAPNLVTRYTGGGVADGVCIVGGRGGASLDCLADRDSTRTLVPAANAWPVGPTYWADTVDTEADGRSFVAANYSPPGLGCWDWSTMAPCTGPRFDGTGHVTTDVDGNGLPPSYGTTWDGSCIVSAGDSGRVFTMDVDGNVPCTSLGSGRAAAPVDLRAARCDGTVGKGAWRAVTALGVDLTAGAQFSSFVVRVRDAATGQVVAQRDLVGTNGVLDLSKVDPVSHPALIEEAQVISVTGKSAWGGAKEPLVRLTWTPDPLSACFRATVTVDCTTAAPTSVSVSVTVNALAAVTTSVPVRPAASCPTSTPTPPTNPPTATDPGTTSPPPPGTTPPASSASVAPTSATAPPTPPSALGSDDGSLAETGVRLTAWLALAAALLGAGLLVLRAGRRRPAGRQH